MLNSDDRNKLASLLEKVLKEEVNVTISGDDVFEIMGALDANLPSAGIARKVEEGDR